MTTLATPIATTTAQAAEAAAEPTQTVTTIIFSTKKTLNGIIMLLLETKDLTQRIIFLEKLKESR
ncbi:MAG TPA: hypothetical protein VIP70_09200 [Nitrososphaeraceae archaeon]